MTKLLHYKVHSSEQKNTSKRPLIMLHGLFGSMDNWRSQAKRLSQSRTVITVDLRNHGHSPHLAGMSYKEMAKDVITVLEHENLSEVDLLGHSMGGKVAMWLAMNFAEYFASLTVVDIAPKAYPLWHQKSFAAMMNIPLKELTSRKSVEQFFETLLDDDVERAFLSKNLRRREEGGYEWRCNLNEIAKGYLKIAAFPSKNQIFIKKACFIRGGDSHYITVDDHCLIKSMFPQAEIYSIADAGHLPHIEQADAFYQKILEFLDS